MISRNSCLYLGSVVHNRLRPRRHRLAYRVFSMLIDLDELPALDRDLALFSHNRLNLFAFHDCDHGAADGTSLRVWVEAQLEAAGIAGDGGPIRLLCYPGVLGYVFDPISVYFCHKYNGRLVAILYEVRNTFGQRHSYLIPAPENDASIIRQQCGKEFYVSPFIDMEMTYHFRIRPPGEAVSIGILETDADGPLLSAVFSGQRRPLGNGLLARLFVVFPLLTLKITAGIHWEAFRLWCKGVPLVRRPKPPAHPVSVVRTKQSGVGT